MILNKQNENINVINIQKVKRTNVIELCVMKEKECIEMQMCPESILKFVAN